MLYTYDFKKVICLLGGLQLQGFADGTAIECDLDDDLYSKVTGADGDIARARRHGLAGNAKITLMQTSPGNLILTGFMAADLAENAGVFPLFIKDVLGTSLFFAPQAWVKKPAGGGFGKELINREWMLDLGQVDYAVGGNTPVLA